MSADAIYKIMEDFVSRCLLDDGSLFTPGKAVWTRELLDGFHSRFVDNAIMQGDLSFFEKLEKQLEGAPEEMCQLAAELMYVHLIVALRGTIRPETKREYVRNILGMMKAPIEIPAEMDEALGTGLVQAGQAFNSYRYYMLVFLVEVGRKIKTLGSDEREVLLMEPWAFHEFLSSMEASRANTQREALLHLVFPKIFECIVSKEQKSQIATRLRRFVADPDVDLDRRLLEIRHRLGKERDLHFESFYDEEVRFMWQEELGSPFDTIFVDMEEGDWFFDLCQLVIGKLEVDPLSDPRVVMTLPQSGAKPRLSFNFGNWRILYINGSSDDAKRIQIALVADDVHDSDLQEGYNFQQNADELDIRSFHVSIDTMREMPTWLKVAFEKAIDHVRTHLRHSMHARHHVPALVEGVLDAKARRRLLVQGIKFNVPDADGDEGLPEVSEVDAVSAQPAYTIEEAMNDLFMEQDAFEKMVALLKTSKNIILQGPPGVGKTFVAQRIAYALMREKAKERVRMVQFHQSYSYEDFVQGFRPTNDGKFRRKDGVFYRFSEKARKDEERPYVFIIDEINRGNLSKIFGELMMLVEADKRGPDWGMPLQYGTPEDPPFHVPENVHLIGMMNTADRSLAVVDYALRRRFRFVDISPALQSRRFAAYLAGRHVPTQVIELIQTRIGRLNRTIAQDIRQLGPGFCIGHSFFCPALDEPDLSEAWYRRVIEYEIGPLLKEYYFDDPERAEQEIINLLG